MGVSTVPFGIHSYGRQAYIYKLTNSLGWTVELTNLGAAVRAVMIPGRDGRLTDVAVCHGSFEDCITNPHDLGAVCGRIYGRLSKPGFMLEGRYYEVPATRGRGLPMAVKPFSCSIWKTGVTSGGAVTFSRLSPGGEQGLPGKLDVSVSYTWDDDGKLSIDYSARSDAVTAVDLTNNLFVNLGGAGSGLIFGHELYIAADSHMPTDSDLCVTGEILPVKGAPLDFNKPDAIEGRVNGEYWFVDKDDIGGPDIFPERKVRLRARASCPTTGLSMTMYTDMPAIRLDTGASLLSYLGKGGTPMVTNGALCLAAGLPPDAVNRRYSPSPFLRPGEIYSQHTEYVFGTDS